MEYLRLCIYNEKKYWCHFISHEGDVLLEDENGILTWVSSMQIRFLDTPPFPRLEEE